jgi:DNA-binding response OmpR family regulator
VLVDVMLPGMNGFELCRGIRQRLDTPVIMVTARSEGMTASSDSKAAPTTT